MKNDDLKQVDVTLTKPSIEEPPELELKDLPSHLEYAFLEGTDKLPVIISKELKDEEKIALLKVLKSHKRAIALKIFDIKGINPSFCTHKILMEDNFKPAVQHQRRVNPKIHEVIKKEVTKLLDARLIYPISDSLWVSPVYCVPKKGGMTVIENDNNELIPTRLVTGWRVCIDYRKLNDATGKDHFLLPFMDQMLERLAGNEYYCFLDGFSGYFQIPIDPKDQDKTTFTCPYGTFAYRHMPFGLCNAPGTDSFSSCLSNLDKILKQCEDTSLVLNWEKCHFMVKEGIVLGHNISKSEIEVDRAKVDVIAKLYHPTFVKGVRETPFVFSKECTEAFNIVKKKLTEAPILVAPDWDLPFEIMCDASDYAVGAVLGQYSSAMLHVSKRKRHLRLSLVRTNKGKDTLEWKANITTKSRIIYTEYNNPKKKALTPNGEVDIIKKAENQAKMTKLSMEWKRLCKNAKVRVNTKESAVKPEPELKNTIGCNLNPSDGPGKPNSIIMKTVKTKWALNQFQQPICVQLTKTVKTLKAQS
ncbi:reverse transcriptase domain-containing protein [Tanacetum coccineum]